jgi:DeoR/GlpR family transcriptional regulator of sugar metabolism
VIVLADASKWGGVGLADIAPLAAAHVVITDDKLPKDALEVLHERVNTVVTVHDEKPG